MKAADPMIIILFDELEVCPECGHMWSEDGPAHFTDCRYFSLDDDREEEELVEISLPSYQAA